MQIKPLMQINMRFNHFVLSLALSSIAAQAAHNQFTPGETWTDTSGKHINAHGCCVVWEDGAYYLFGEDRSGSTSNGVSCYKSTDLMNWTRLGLAMKTADALDPETGKALLERPKVIYNAKTGKWVLYAHWENGNGYGEARVCVGVSDNITGPYAFVSTFRPNGHDSRDQTVFVDTDGQAYHFCATGMNTDINIALLSDDYLSTEQNPVTETQVLNMRRLEAPAIIKEGDTYFGIFSGCSGWDPNPGHTAYSYDILGDWEETRNFAIDDGSATTYSSQSTYILRVEGRKGAYIYMGDRWNSSNVGDSKYVWLPLSLRSGLPTVKWHKSWDMSVFDNCDRYHRPVRLDDGMHLRMLDRYSDRWISSKGNGLFIDDDNEATNLEFVINATENPYVWTLTDAKTGKNLESQLGALIYSEPNEEASQRWRFEIQEDGCYVIQNVNDSKVLTVSGSSQLAKTPVFMSKKGAAESQYFGLYFDSDTFDYTQADIFSASYRAGNRTAIEEQAEFEREAGIGSLTPGDNYVATARNGILEIKGLHTSPAKLRLTDMRSGLTVWEAVALASAGCTRVSVQGIEHGIYILEVESKGLRHMSKIIF